MLHVFFINLIKLTARTPKATDNLEQRKYKNRCYFLLSIIMPTWHIRHVPHLSCKHNALSRRLHVVEYSSVYNSGNLMTYILLKEFNKIYYQKYPLLWQKS